MTGLDTNVLVRYLTEDDPEQARRAGAWVDATVARGEDCFVSAIVLCEMAWVLRGAYDVSKSDLLRTLDQLLATVRFVIGDKDVIRKAIDAYRAGRADFADYVIGALNREVGCEKTVTFDRRLRGDGQFVML
jgi:predicted nucleic-acid-binding protein